MKQAILSILIVCGIFTVSNAQNNLFSNISTTDQYHRFSSIHDADGDGVYEISDRDLIVKFNTEYIPTGEGYGVEVVIEEGSSKGKTLKRMDALHAYSTCAGYPYESLITDRPTKETFVAIDDYVFVLYKVSNDGTSYQGISQVFIKIKEDAEATETKTAPAKGKKKKMSMKDRLKALEELKNKLAVNYGPGHKELQSKNIDKLITDYLVAMKSKQDARTASERKQDNNLEIAKKQDAAEIKAYNDKIKASPEYKKMKAHQKRMEEMDNNNTAKSVTIENRAGRDIYVYREGFKNGTLIRNNSSTKLNCSYNYTYKYDSNSSGNGSTCYSANSRCGSSITVN